MIKFCNFKGQISACDDNTINLYNLKVIYTCTEEDYINAGSTYYVVNNKVILGKSEKMMIEEQICDLKAVLNKYKEDVEQVELFGMERADYEEKKKACANIIISLRELEQKYKTLV